MIDPPRLGVVAWARTMDSNRHRVSEGAAFRTTPDEEATSPPLAAKLTRDESDVARLFRSERARLCHSVRRRVVDPEEAADIVQDAFARFAQVSPALSLRAPVAYLQRIVRNLLRDRAKRAERRYAFCDLTVVEAEISASAAEQEWTIEAGDLMDRYVRALADLSPRTREVFLLHRIDELRYRDIADRLGITVATVEYHMSRALVQLDKAINQ